MSGEDHNFTVWGFIKGFGKFLIGILLLLQGLIGLVLMFLIVSVIVSVSNGVAGGKAGAGATIQPGSALLLNPQGVLVEQARQMDPLQQLFANAYGYDKPPQVQLSDVLTAIREAKTDDRIKAIVLDLSRLDVPATSATKIHDIAKALDDFKAGGKKVVAIGDGYSQEQYLIAAHANEILMHDYGQVILPGYGAYGVYLKSLLEKLKVTTHVFRVGAFKSAVEPFIRDDMSPEAKEADRAFLGVMWDEYAKDIEAARRLPAGSIQHYADDLGAIMKKSDGDFAKAALDYGLVDKLESRPEQLAYLKKMFGEDKSGKSFKRVGFRRYLAAVDGDDKDGPAPNIAVVTAAGDIVDGEAEPGVAAGGDTIAGYLKKALDDDNVKAVVLRVDSPGGSAFASEIIRDGILSLKKAGKPVVVSMGSIAASGGYWISSAGDEIFAEPTTITGSIGIFGLITTYENTAAWAGVHVDGVGTTALSPLLATGIGPLPEAGADVIQQSVEQGYRRFISVVSEGRHLQPDYVDSIAQGRVWIGKTALELKLVDKMGDLDDAIAAAAKLAKLDNYDVIDEIDRRTPFEKLFQGAEARILAMAGVDQAIAKARTISPFAALVKDTQSTVDLLKSFNDPNGVYARCLACEAR
ncbi:MAG: signal peptide peptidase SppA [Alphaproteobacteria bacterium]|nr:signal peptide peptidase SppA [Alphaproteobacteria bacterium]